MRALPGQPVRIRICVSRMITAFLRYLGNLLGIECSAGCGEVVGRKVRGSGADSTIGASGVRDADVSCGTSHTSNPTAKALSMTKGLCSSPVNKTLGEKVTHGGVHQCLLK